MLELINRARANPNAEAARLGVALNGGLAPGTISPSPKPPLAAHPALIRAARKHSQWMLDSGVFSHTGAGNSSPGGRMTAENYVFSGSSGWGENIAWGGTSGTPQLTKETIARHEGLFRSPGHRTNLCNPTLRHVGLGVKSGQFQGWNAVMATQCFAHSAAYPEPLLVGVVFEDRDGDGFYDPGEGLPGIVVVPDGGMWEAVTSSSGGYAVPYTGNSGSLSVTFSGSRVGQKVSRSIERTGSNLHLNLNIAGNSIKAPEIVVQQPAGTGLVAGETKRIFGSAKAGGKGLVKTFTLKNTGTADLTGLVFTTNGTHAQDFIVAAPSRTSLAPGASVTFKVTFKPRGKGTRSASLRIKSNDADENPFTIRLTGYGVR